VSVYYCKNGGNDGNSGLSDLLAWATLGHASGFSLAAGDSCLLKRGSIWREVFNNSHAGTSGAKITLGAYDTGANPIVNGATLVTGWTVYSGNVWQATVTGINSWDKDIFIDETHGDHKTSAGACVNEFDWYWAANVLYLYAASDPGTLYTAPGVEVRTRQYLITCSQAYWIFDGLTVEKAYQDNFKMDGSANCEIKNCTVQYGGGGVTSYGSTATTGLLVHDNLVRLNHETGIIGNLNSTNFKVYRNEVSQNGRIVMLSGDNYDGGIKFWDQHDGAADGGHEFYENYIHDNLVGFWLDGVQPPGDPILFHHNWMENNATQAIMLELSSKCQIWGNVLVNCGTSVAGEGEAWASAGINLSGRDDPSGTVWSVHDNLIYNNTIYGGNIGINVWQNTYGYTASSMVNNIVKNNIVYGQTLRPLSCGQGGDNDPAWNSSGNTYQYNCFGPQATNFIRWARVGYFSTYAAWEAAAGVILDGGSTHSINADPALTNPSGGVFTLQAGSPCIDVGANLGATYKYGLLAASTWPSGVVTGDQGAYGAGWEVGAYIYQPPTAWMIAHLAAGGS
jgi:hypothetical protein